MKLHGTEIDERQLDMLEFFIRECEDHAAALLARPEYAGFRDEFLDKAAEIFAVRVPAVCRRWQRERRERQEVQ